MKLAQILTTATFAALFSTPPAMATEAETPAPDASAVSSTDSPTPTQASDNAALAEAAADLGFAFDPETNTVPVAPEAATTEDQTVELRTDSTPTPVDEASASTGKLVDTDDPDSVPVTNAAGEILGSWYISRSLNSDGAAVPAELHVESGSLSVSSPSDAAVEVVFLAAKDRGEDTFTEREAIIGVPGEYRYNPAEGRLHDFCSNSPDEFPNPVGPNAPFQGPCALHDLCIEKAGFHDPACDPSLRADMKNNCRATYGPGPTRATCEATADTYYFTIKAVTSAR